MARLFPLYGVSLKKCPDSNYFDGIAMEIVQRFYDAFVARDGEAMAACYAENVSFSDPVFPNLNGKDAGDMWRMLCKSGKDLAITYKIESESNPTIVHWDAHYTFSKTGRKVHNQVRAEIEVIDGKILRHKDDFSFWRWSRQALGPAGLLLGWTPFLKNKVRETAALSLRLYQQNT